MSAPKVVHLLGDANLAGVRRVIDTLMSGRKLADIAQQVSPIRNPREWRAGSRGADVIVLHDSVSWQALPWLAWLRVLRPRAKLILVEHSYCAGFERHRVAHRWRFRTMLSLAYALVNTVVAVSTAQRRWMLDAQIASPRKVQVIYPHLDYSTLLRLQAPSGASRLRIGAIGRLHEQKGFDRLLHAVRAIARVDVEVLIAGEGPETDHLRALARGLSQVRFVGPVEDVEQFMSHVDVVVVPSRYEPFGIVASEARAAGRPILVTAADGLAEQVMPGTGWVIEGNALPTLVQTLDSLPPRQALREAGNLARESITGEFEVSMHRWRMLLLSPS